jgi:DNA-binding MarR family transcriptional regulator
VVETREELERKATAQFRQMMHRFKANCAPVWMSIDLTVPQLRTLFILAEGEPLVIGQIAQRLGIGLSTGGHLVDRLVQAGLAERTEDMGDRRRTLVRLTQAGEDLSIQLLSGIQQIPVLIQQLDESDLSALWQGLQAINQLVDQRAHTNRINREVKDFPAIT